MVPNLTTKSMARAERGSGRGGKAANLKAGLNHPRMDAAVPDVRNIAGVQEVAQVAAAIGREFSCQLLAPVAARGENDLTTALGRFGEAGLVFARGTPPAASYQFSCNVGGSARAYGRDRNMRSSGTPPPPACCVAAARSLHARIADVLAQHFTEAGLAEQAVAYWLRAGERAVARSANLEAVAHFGRGIEILRALPESAERDEQELALQVALVPPLWACRGFGSPEARQASRRAVDLCRRGTSDKFMHFRALYGLAYAYLLPGDLRSARPLAEQLLEFAERLRDPELLAYAHFEMGCELFWPGEFVAAREYLERGITLWKVTNDDRADWREAWALYPGDVAYIWHGGVHAGVVQTSLEVCRFTARSQIIWAKSQLVISRGHYHAQHEPCFYAVRDGATGHWTGDRKQTTLYRLPHKGSVERYHRDFLFRVAKSKRMVARLRDRVLGRRSRRVSSQLHPLSK
jgi:tetratricopeptide (TPR) repeat protein